jgi:aldose sugar dehydrogenase
LQAEKKHMRRFFVVRAVAGFTAGVMLLLAIALTVSPLSAQMRTFPLGEGPWYYDTHEVGTGIRVSVVTRGLVNPWSMAFLPNTATSDHPMGDALITEREGRVRLLRAGVLEPEPVVDIANIFPVHHLFDIALDADFVENGTVYLSYIKQGQRPDGNAGFYATTALAVARFDGERLSDVRDLFVADGWSNGIGGVASRVTLGPDGKLYISSSHRLDLEAPQDLGSHIGKVLRLNTDGSVPDDNPFVGIDGALPEIFTYGHRSVMGLVFHPETGELWETENGPHGGDEVNILRAGHNYGWPIMTYGRDYDGSGVTSGSRPWVEGVQQPELVWVPSITVSSLSFYTADAFPAWRDNLFVSAMIAGRVPGTGHVQRIVFSEHGEVLREQLLNNLRQRIRYVNQGPDGLIYLLTDETDGVVLRMEPAATAEPEP